MPGFYKSGSRSQANTGFYTSRRQRGDDGLATVRRLEDYGYNVPRQSGWSIFGKKSLGVLSTMLDFLRTDEYAVGGLLSGKTPLRGIVDRTSPSEALGIIKKGEDVPFFSAKGLTALTTDILLSPSTYLSFGTTGVMKMATKSGMIPITKIGRNVMREMIERGASEAVARRTMAKLIQRGGEKAAEKYIGKSGLKFMGKVFVPAEDFEIMGDLIQKVPGAGKLNKVGSGIAKAFVPFRDIEKLPVKLGGKGTYTDMLFKPFSRETRAKIFKETDEIKKLILFNFKKLNKFYKINNIPRINFELIYSRKEFNKKIRSEEHTSELQSH